MKEFYDELIAVLKEKTLSKEEADKIEAHIENYFSPPKVVAKVEVPPQKAPEAIPPVSGVLPEKAIAVREAGNEFQVVVVGFNPETKEAKVESIESTGIYKRDAFTKLKVLANKYGFV